MSSTIPRRARRSGLLRLLRSSPVSGLAAIVSALLLCAGVAAVIADELRLAAALLIVTQLGILVLILDQQRLSVRRDRELRADITQASSRTLADLARLQHTLLTAIDDLPGRDD